MSRAFVYYKTYSPHGGEDTQIMSLNEYFPEDSIFRLNQDDSSDYMEPIRSQKSSIGNRQKCAGTAKRTGKQPHHSKEQLMSTPIKNLNEYFPEDSIFKLEQDGSRDNVEKIRLHKLSIENKAGKRQTGGGTSTRTEKQQYHRKEQSMFSMNSSQTPRVTKQRGVPEERKFVYEMRSMSLQNQHTKPSAEWNERGHSLPNLNRRGGVKNSVTKTGWDRTLNEDDCSVGLMCCFPVQDIRSKIDGLVSNGDDSCWVFSKKEQQLLRIGPTGEVLEKFHTSAHVIGGVTVDPDGNVYYSCTQEKQIKRIDANRRKSVYYEPRNYPTGIAYHRKRKELLVCLNSTADMTKGPDTRNTIVSYKHDKVIPKVKSLPKSTKEHLLCPYRVRCCKLSGDIYVADFTRKCIVVMDENMKFKYEISCDDFLVRDYGVPAFTLDKHGRIFLFDARNSLLRLLSPDGRTRQVFDVGVQTDCKLDFDSEDRLWVAQGKEISIYQF